MENETENDLKSETPWGLIQLPILSDWSAKVAGVTFTPLKGQEPSAFHRFMQRLCFGVEWTLRKRGAEHQRPASNLLTAHEKAEQEAAAREQRLREIKDSLEREGG